MLSWLDLSESILTLFTLVVDLEKLTLCVEQMNFIALLLYRRLGKI